MHAKLSFLLMLFPLVLLPTPSPAEEPPEQIAPVWIEDRFEDFADGQFDASGRDLYATRNGTIKTVNRFDFNDDGHVDLVFNQSHDEKRVLPPTVVTASGNRKQGKLSELAARGTNDVAFGDFNRDGYLDAVFSPCRDGGTPRRFLSIFWGGPEGWVNHRRTALVAMNARRVVTGDLDGDGFEDVAVLNATRWAPEDGPGAVVRVYFGGKSGFAHADHKDLVIRNAVDMKAADVDADGKTDLALLVNKPGEVLLFRGGFRRADRQSEPQRIGLDTPTVGRLALADVNRDRQLDFIVSGGLREVIDVDPTTGKEIYRYSGILCAVSGRQPGQWQKPRSIKARVSTNMALADLNRDDCIDVILADNGDADESVQILWGDRQGSFARRAPTNLPVPYVGAVAVADLDGDDNRDMVAAPLRGEETNQSPSHVFYGDGRGGFVKADYEIPTSGVASIGIAPGADGSGHRIVFCNTLARRLKEDFSTRVFWGSPRGFRRDRFDDYSMRSSYASYGADLNDDGHADLILLSIVHGRSEWHSQLGMNILWGGPDGLKNDRRTVLKEYGLWGINVADLDRDGYLDLIAAVYRASPEGDPEGVVVWHGGPRGFQRDRRVKIPLKGRPTQLATADYNKDGHLDVAVAVEAGNSVVVFWGAKSGLAKERSSRWPLHGPADINTADLNADGWLDIIATSHSLRPSMHWDFGTYIFWGSSRGFDPTNALRLPAHDGLGITVADWDADGHLDLLLPSYNYGNIRQSIAGHLFWGSAQGFRDADRTDFLQDAACAAMAADFNGDGLLDMAVANHSKNGDHFTESQVFFNDNQRFTEAKVQKLPTIGPHYMQRVDVGHVYSRSYRQQYVSSVFAFGDPCRGGTLAWSGQAKFKSRLEMSIRSAKTEEELARQPWRSLGPTSESRFDLDATDRCLQYRAVFISANGDCYPVLDRVGVTLRR